MVTITFEGLDEMAQDLLKKANPAKRQRLLRQYGAMLKANVTVHAQFTRGYSTGATRRSLTLQVSGDKAEVQATTNYSGYVEEIGRAHV